MSIPRLRDTREVLKQSHQSNKSNARESLTSRPSAPSAVLRPLPVGEDSKQPVTANGTVE